MSLNNFAHALCVSVSKANLRGGPGMVYQKTGVALKYTPLKALIKKEDWYKVEDADGRRHWIYKELVTEEYLCAVVIVYAANIRNGPGRKYQTVYISPGFKNDRFKILKSHELWVNVENEFNVTGWIYRKLLWIQ